MKNLLIASMVVLFMSSAAKAAEDDTAAAEQAVRNALCFLMSTKAELAMTMRQLGLPTTQTLEIMTRNYDADHETFSVNTNEAIKKITSLAYERPMHSIEFIQKKEIQDFSADINALCLRGIYW